jgi:hypothetical protein
MVEAGSLRVSVWGFRGPGSSGGPRKAEVRRRESTTGRARLDGRWVSDRRWGHEIQSGEEGRGRMAAVDDGRAARQPPTGVGGGGGGGGRPSGWEAVVEGAGTSRRRPGRRTRRQGWCWRKKMGS